MGEARCEGGASPRTELEKKHFSDGEPECDGDDITVERGGEGNAASFLATATDKSYPGYSCVLPSGCGRDGARATTAPDGQILARPYRSCMRFRTQSGM